jgi:hypothetical protein
MSVNVFIDKYKIIKIRINKTKNSWYSDNNISKLYVFQLEKVNNPQLTAETSKFVFQCGPYGFGGIREPGVCRFERDHIIRHRRIVHENGAYDRARTI